MDSDNPVPGPGGAAQSTDQLDWLAHFQSQTQDLDIKAGKRKQEEEDSSCPDEVQIQIEDLEKKISELKAQLKTHVKKGGITMDDSREMKDLIEKYSVKLDNIDFMGRTDALTGRRIELLYILLKTQKKLDALSKIEKPSLNQQSGLIVKVEDGKLEINESAVRSVLDLCSKKNFSGKYGISLVSIVGDRKSGKSHLFESVQNHAVGREWKVLTQSKGTLECSGISCCVLCVDEMEKRRLVFLMDIVCDESCNSEIYTKLVDFCILASDVVFYTEKEELDLVDTQNPCYWNVDRSIFTTLPLPIRSTLNTPLVFVLTRDLEYLYLQETPLLEFRSNRILQQESENAESPSSPPQNQGSSLKGIVTNPAPSTSSTLTGKHNPKATNEVELYNENLRYFFQSTQFFQNVAGSDVDFGTVEDIGKVFENFINKIEREFPFSTDRSPSSPQHPAEETSIFPMYKEDVTKLVVKKALETYDNYMRCQTEQQIFTDSEIQGFHDYAHLVLTAETVLSRLKKRQREDYLRLVSDHLTESRHSFIIQNQTKIMEKVKARRMLTEEVKMMYSELLSRYPASDSYNDFVRSARTFAWKLYEKKAKGKSLNVAAWKNAFLSKVDALNQQILVDKISQRTPQISLEDFSKEFRKLELCLRDEDEASVSLVFNLSPSSLQAAVFILDSTQRRDIKSEWNSPVFRDHWPPCIVFRAGGTTLIGKEALNSEQTSSDNFFNLYEMLLRGTNQRNTVKMNKIEESLEVEEIFAMFLFKIKRQIETELNIHLTSATFAMCSLFSTTAKHMVKTSLSLAGFQHSVLLQTKTAAIVGELVRRRDSGQSQFSILLLHDETEILQLCILENGPHLEVKSFINLMSARISTAFMVETILENLGELGHRLTSAIIMPMSPLCQHPQIQTQRRLTTALTELKKYNRDFENCEILIRNVDECRILLGAHLCNNPTCDQMNGIKINESNCNVFGEMKKALWFCEYFLPVSVCKFSNDSDFLYQTNKSRMVLNVKMRGKDELCICEESVGRPEDRKVAMLTRVNQDDRPPSEADERAQEEVQIVTKYLLPHQVEAAKAKLFKYFKTKILKIEDSWKTFVKNTDSMSKWDEGCGEI